MSDKELLKSAKNSYADSEKLIAKLKSSISKASSDLIKMKKKNLVDFRGLEKAFRDLEDAFILAKGNVNDAMSKVQENIKEDTKASMFLSKFTKVEEIRTGTILNSKMYYSDFASFGVKVDSAGLYSNYKKETVSPRFEVSWGQNERIFLVSGKEFHYKDGAGVEKESKILSSGIEKALPKAIKAFDSVMEKEVKKLGLYPDMEK